MFCLKLFFWTSAIYLNVSIDEPHVRADGSVTRFSLFVWNGNVSVSGASIAARSVSNTFVQKQDHKYTDAVRRRNKKCSWEWLMFEEHLMLSSLYTNSKSFTDAITSHLGLIKETGWVSSCLLTSLSYLFCSQSSPSRCRWPFPAPPVLGFSVFGSCDITVLIAIVWENNTFSDNYKLYSSQGAFTGHVWMLPPGGQLMKQPVLCMPPNTRLWFIICYFKTNEADKSSFQVLNWQQFWENWSDT